MTKSLSNYVFGRNQINDDGITISNGFKIGVLTSGMTENRKSEGN